MPGALRRSLVEAVLDFVAGRARPGESPDETRRIRVASALALVLLSQVTCFALWTLVTMGPTLGLVTLLVSMPIHGTSLAVARQLRRPQIAGFITCLSVNLISAGLALYEDGASILTLPISLAIPILAMYLCGRRTGWGFTVLLVVELLVEEKLHQHGFSPGRLLPEGGGSLDMAVVNGLGVIALGAVGWLHSMERGKALETVAASEANLLSVVESTSDLVVSADRELKLVVANDAFVKGILARYGEPPKIGHQLPAQAFQGATWQQYVPAALAGERVHFLEQFQRQGRKGWMEINFNPVRSKAGEVVGVTAFCRDITDRKQAEAQMEELHRELLVASRHAGMAEVATGVLHNVGNALNSVNVSAQMIGEKLTGSAVASLERAAALAAAHRGDGAFWAGDPKGLQLPGFIEAAAATLREQREEASKELRAILEGLEHIKSVVAMQQGFARASGVTQHVEPGQLLDDALRLDAGAFERLGVHVRRELHAEGAMSVDRHRVLQILVNLLSNARHAVAGADRPDREIVLRSAEAGPGMVRFEVQDNGVGIPPENMEAIFRQGFTTKQGGHGFGLHASANAARELGGTLTCSSGGPGAGAVFRLELPRVPAPKAGAQGEREGAWAA